MLEIGDTTEEGFTVVAMCGYCGKVHKYTHPEPYGWVYMDKYDGAIVNAWFCSKKCYLDQINSWAFNRKDFEEWKKNKNGK